MKIDYSIGSRRHSSNSLITPDVFLTLFLFYDVVRYEHVSWSFVGGLKFRITKR
jgi:hypothetical protein